MRFLDALFRRKAFYLVQSPPSVESFAVRQTPGGAKRLYQSEFQIAWLAELGIKPQIIFDVGSYDGGDALRFSDAFPAARVVAVEADPERFPIVRTNCLETPVTAVEAAILDRDGPVDWFQATFDGKVDSQGSLYRHTEALNRRFPQVEQNTRPMSVRGLRLDSLCRALAIDKIDFLHMDIQGADYAALLGLGELRPQAIYLETERAGWIGAGTVHDISRLMEEWDYRLAADLRGDRLYRSPRPDARGSSEHQSTKP